MFRIPFLSMTYLNEDCFIKCAILLMYVSFIFSSYLRLKVLNNVLYLRCIGIQSDKLSIQHGISSYVQSVHIFFICLPVHLSFFKCNTVLSLLNQETSKIP